MATISAYKVEDLRFPTSLDGDGTDASKSLFAHLQLSLFRKI